MGSSKLVFSFNLGRIFSVLRFGNTQWFISCREFQFSSFLCSFAVSCYWWLCRNFYHNSSRTLIMTLFEKDLFSDGVYDTFSGYPLNFAFEKWSESCSVMSDSLSPWTVACYASLSMVQAKILEWLAIPFSRGSSPPWDRTQVSLALQADSLSSEPPGKSIVHICSEHLNNLNYVF